MNVISSLQSITKTIITIMINTNCNNPLNHLQMQWIYAPCESDDSSIYIILYHVYFVWRAYRTTWLKIWNSDNVELFVDHFSFFGFKVLWTILCTPAPPETEYEIWIRNAGLSMSKANWIEMHDGYPRGFHTRAIIQRNRQVLDKLPHLQEETISFVSYNSILTLLFKFIFCQWYSLSYIFFWYRNHYRAMFQ